MKNLLLHSRYLLMALVSLFCTSALADDIVNKTKYDDDVTVTWPCNLGSTNPTEGEVSLNGAFSITSNTVGSKLTITGTGTAKATDGTVYTYTKYQPTEGNAAAHTDGMNVDFMITPSKGLTFTPSAVAINATRFGTDGGLLDIYYVKDGVETLLKEGFKPGRSGKTPALTDTTIVIPSTLASSGEGIVRVYQQGLGTTKQFGLCNIVIKGKVSGTLEQVEKYSLTTTVSPAEGGSIIKKPNADTYDKDTEVTLTATRNFGYKFTNWTNTTTGDVVSTEESFIQTMTSDTQLTANFEKINTYSLATSVAGGANYYMVSLSPSPTVIDEKNMYEDGTTVTLTASSNDILTFSNWNTGETTATKVVTMDKDQEYTANYDAKDYIVGWDFYLPGNNGRAADFTSDGNDATSLILRTADGTTSGWLDKGNAQGGNEGRNAAVNWKNLSDKYYFQTCVNASAFTNIKVKSSMMYNYNAYQIQNVDYSLDGTDWTTVGSIDMSTAVKTWADSTFTLPEAANNKDAVYIRWIPDYTSAINGTASNNDGTTIAGIYITGDKKYVNDGVAPLLTSQIPEANATGISNSGKIVLVFDEKVKVNDGAYGEILQEGKSSGSNNKSEYQKITPVVTGKTMTFAYNNLAYTSNYTFTIAANTISDYGDNFINSAITINFTTKSHPTIAKGMYDFIVPDDGTFAEAIAAAAKRDNTSTRYYIFVKNGSYKLEGDNGLTVVGSDKVTYAKPTTIINTPNVSIIGESMDGTTLYNEAFAEIEGLGKCELIDMTKSATNIYMQDMTLKNGMPYDKGRAAALEDSGDKNMYKNVCLFGGQDTYKSNNQSGRFYFENGSLEGYTDYLCGKGDVYYNGVNLIIRRDGTVISAPSQPKQYGYVFADCAISAEKADYKNYTLGRPWGSGTPRAVFINTTMNVQATSTGWSEMSGGYPALFAEYNSHTASGIAVDLSSRKTIFADTHTNTPVLTAAEAAEYTISKVMGGDDDWDPTYYTEQASAPQNVKISAGNITWDNSDYVFCYAICKNGSVIAFTKESTFAVPADATTTDKFTIRAANEYGGLSEASDAATTSTGIDNVTDLESANCAYYNLQGVRVNKSYRGVIIKVDKTKEGNKKASKIVR